MQALSANRTIRIRTRPTARCEGSKEQQTALRSAGSPADGFLKHRFLPLCEPADELPEEQLATGGFFKSLDYLYRHYGVVPMDVSHVAYPANVILSYRNVRRQIKIQGRQRALKIIEKETGQVSLQVTETIDTGNTLFYIPVIPLYHWHKKRQNRKTAELLLGICAFLFHDAGVPYFRDPDTYLGGNYQMMQDWVTDDCGDMDTEDLSRQQSHLNCNYHYGDRMQRRIQSKVNWHQLADRVNRFHPANDYQKEVFLLAKQALHIQAQYPNRNIYQHQNEPEFDEDAYDYDYYSFLRIDDYVSFIGETTSSLYDSMMEMINNDLNERSQVLEPQVITVFDNPAMPYQDGLSYEHQMFDLISELCTLLYELP